MVSKKEIGNRKRSDDFGFRINNIWLCFAITISCGGPTGIGICLCSVILQLLRAPSLSEVFGRVPCGLSCSGRVRENRSPLGYKYMIPKWIYGGESHSTRIYSGSGIERCCY